MAKKLTLTQEEIELVLKYRNGSRGIYWSVNDFEHIANEVECNEVGESEDNTLYDRSKFAKALEDMIDGHDADNGITWYTIRYYLDEYCKIETDAK